MKRISIISSLLFTFFIGTAVLFQNCSKPLQDVSGDGGGDSTCVGSGCGTSGTIGAIISTSPGGAYANEVDLNKNYYARYTGFANANDIYACAQIFTGANADCPNENHRPIGNDIGFTFTNGVGQKEELACPLSNCTIFSHSVFYGSSFQLEVANADYSKKIKRVFYVRPPHLSSGFNEQAVWYTFNSDGRDRIIHWAQNRPAVKSSTGDNLLSTYVAEGEAFYSNWFNNTSKPIQICIKSFSTANAPAASTCASGDWNPLDLPHTVTSADGKHKYNFNEDGLPANKYVAFIRDASTQAVYNYATTVIVVE